MRASACALLALSTACGGTSLAWYGHTPDRTGRIEVHQAAGAQWLTLGERASRRYRFVAAEELAFDPAGRHLAFAAEVSSAPERWTVVKDFVEGRTWDGVAGLRWSPDGRRFVHAALDGGLWRMVVDGIPQGAHASVDPDSVAFSPDGRRVGYTVQDGACARAVVDTHEGDCAGRVVGLALADVPSRDVVVLADGGDGREAHVHVGADRALDLEGARDLAVDARGLHWAVVEVTSRGSRVVADGAPQPMFERVEHLVWSADGGRLAYAARGEGAWRVVVDGRASPPYAEVDPPVLAPSGERYGYVARSGGRSVVVVDGAVAWESPSPATGLTFSDDGARVAWMYRDEQGAVVAVDAERHRFDVAVERALRFSRDGRHWAVLVGSLAERALYVVVDGAVRLPFDAEELFGSPVAGTEPGARLGAWVSAEMERYLARAGARGS
jgi:hypothetical protein